MKYLKRFNESIEKSDMYDYYNKTFNQRNVTKKLTHIGIKYIG